MRVSVNLSFDFKVIVSEPFIRCPVCLEDSYNFLSLECGHQVCSWCLCNMRNLSCPMCRAPLSLEVQHEMLRYYDVVTRFRRRSSRVSGAPLSAIINSYGCLPNG